MFFKAKPKPPLDDALSALYHAMQITYKYKRDEKYTPTAEDMMLFEQICDTLWQNHATAEYIYRTMRERYYPATPPEISRPAPRVKK